jgi:type IV pilus assembly protein PilV
MTHPAAFAADGLLPEFATMENTARGFTLIEVLIVLCLLSLAALSLLELQWRSLNATQQSALHGVAMQLAVDMAERLRAGGELDAAEQADWQGRVAALLPAGRALICQDAAPWDEAAGAYRWACGSGEPPGPQVVKLGWRSAADGVVPYPTVVIVVAPAQP